ncbi:hypothetical protein Avbf_16088 [Armadillidium vulgare]|nr:hypothetical protein Avbf_16088 [Armadillidium vulgare]
MFRKSHILCFLLGICLILANAQKDPQETIVKEENELPLLLEGEEQITEDVTTLAPDEEELLLEDEFLEGEEGLEGLEGEDYVDEEGLDEEIVDEELIDLCTYNPDSKGEVELTYEQQILSQIRKLLKDPEIANNPESLNKMIKLSQNLLLRAVGETPQDILQEEGKTNIPSN